MDMYDTKSDDKDTYACSSPKNNLIPSSEGNFATLDDACSIYYNQTTFTCDL